MRCTACAASLEASSVFPGAKIRCACGIDNVVPIPPRVAEATPYRDPAAPSSPSAVTNAAIVTCPFCGGPCTSDARACPHCDVELAAVRCPECFALHFTGARFCSRCRAELHDGPLLIDASDAPCPRCAKPLASTPLAATREAGVFECTTCGGLFVDHTAFAMLAAEKESAAPPFAGPPPPSVRASATDLEVHYVKCPMCNEVMNRINFGRRSGVIVDVCGLHGTWFDPGELTRVLEWIASGALAQERVREREADSEERREAHQRRVLAAHDLLARHRRDVADGNVTERSADTLLDLLASFFSD